MWRNPEYFTPNPSLHQQGDIDEDLFQPWSPWCIDRGAQARAWRRTTATTAAAARSSATTTRSAKGQEDIYEWWGVFFFFPDGGRRLRPASLSSLKPRPKAARGAKGVGMVSSSDI
ncbi:hypothetical protein VPH35_057552 [Triticum aestivum]